MRGKQIPAPKDLMASGSLQSHRARAWPLRASKSLKYSS
jgi:hypothetical protein